MNKKKRTLQANEIVSLSGDALASVTGGCGGMTSCTIFCSPVSSSFETVCPDSLTENGPENLSNPLDGVNG